jgi:hypothetical protein
MKKIFLIAFAVMTSGFAHADVFEGYQNSGRTALQLALNEPAQAERIVTEINTMIGFGWEIMDLYAVKYPECKAQFEQFKELAKQIDSLSYAQIDELYHDGKGLVAAPRLCYKGRSLVVHPYQVIALAKENRLVKDKAVVDHEMNEVIERAEAIRDILK